VGRLLGYRSIQRILNVQVARAEMVPTDWELCAVLGANCKDPKLENLKDSMFSHVG